jgi:hypothetical protein
MRFALVLVLPGPEQCVQNLRDDLRVDALFLQVRFEGLAVGPLAPVAVFVHMSGKDAQVSDIHIGQAEN